MENWEKQRRLDELERLSRENNQVLEDSNRIEADKVNSINEQNRLIDEQNKLLEQQRWDEERRRQRESEERAEQGFKDRIFNLRTKIAEATDAYQEAKLQALLTEAIAEEEAYYEDKRRREEEAKIRAEQLAQEQLIKERIAEKLQFRRKVFRIIGTLFLLFLALFIGFLAWGFFENQKNNLQSSGFEVAETTLSRESISSSSSDNIASSANNSVPSSSSAETTLSRGSISSSSSDNIASSANNSVSSSSSSELPAPYANTEHTSPHEFTVNVTVTDLNIRQEPSLSAKVGRVIPQGTYTIVQISQSDGHTWGKLKSGEGWISLTAIGEAPLAPNSGRAVRVPEKNTKDLTTEEVANWTKAATLAGRTNLSGQLALEEMLVEVWMADDGLVYADLTATGFPFVDEYRINKNGYLELYTTDGKGDWQVVSEVYTYIQP